MATNYKSPGVYVTEIPKLPASVAQVETAIPAFIGYTEKAEKNGESLLKIPTRITSLNEYEEWFGASKQEAISVVIADVIDETKDNALVNRSLSTKLSSASDYKMHYSLQLFFANGGGPCYIVSVGDYSDTISKADLGSSSAEPGGLYMLEKEDEPTLIVFPDATGLPTVDEFYTLCKDALDQCHKLQDRFLIMNTYTDGDATSIEALRNGMNANKHRLKYGAAYYPFLKSIINYHYLDTGATITHSTVDSEDTTGTGSYDGLTLDAIETTDNVLYESIKSEIRKLTVEIPPSAAISGVYARVDNDRGVWKAPANVGINGIIGPTQKINNDFQDNLNIDDESGKSINAIRAFSGKGTLVWGGRTLAGNDNEWRYISVRRFFNMVEESIKKSTSWAVFEPNNANTWVRVAGMIENYLNGLWRQGALAGSKPSTAFFVKIGIGTTMTTQDILEGRMNVEIGMAVSRPAEFIVLKFSHKLQEA